MTISNERLAEMVGAGFPCVPANPGEIAAIVQEFRSRRQSPAGIAEALRELVRCIRVRVSPAFQEPHHAE